MIKKCIDIIDHMSCGDLNDLILNKPKHLYLWDYNPIYFWTVNEIPVKLLESKKVTLSSYQ
jgi:hypothetical protein